MEKRRGVERFGLGISTHDDCDVHFRFDLCLDVVNIIQCICLRRC